MMQTWYVFDKTLGFLGTVEAFGTADAAWIIGRRWGFTKISRREICWNIHPAPLWGKGMW